LIDAVNKARRRTAWPRRSKVLRNSVPSRIAVAVTNGRRSSCLVTCQVTAAATSGGASSVAVEASSTASVDGFAAARLPSTR
jgi:hypothetical protein